MHVLQDPAQQAATDNECVSGSSPSQVQRPASLAHQGFANVAQKHLAALVGQILVAEGAEDVSLWQPVITRLAMDAAHAVLPSALAAFGVSDPRFYIKVKTPIPISAHVQCIHLLHTFQIFLLAHCSSANLLLCYAFQPKKFCGLLNVPLVSNAVNGLTSTHASGQLASC